MHTPVEPQDWAVFVERWPDLPADVQTAGLAAALGGTDMWTASAARRFVTQHWNGLSTPSRNASLAALESALADATRGAAVWPFFTDHWNKLPGAFRDVVRPVNLSFALIRSKFAADAWEFVTVHWDEVGGPLRSVITERIVADGLGDTDWRVASAVWDFLSECWTHLPSSIRNAVRQEQVEAARRNPLTAIAVADFLIERSADGR